MRKFETKAGTEAVLSTDVAVKVNCQKYVITCMETAYNYKYD